MVRLAISRGHSVVNLDALTYSACLKNVEGVSGNSQYSFEHVNIKNRNHLDQVFEKHKPDAVAYQLGWIDENELSNEAKKYQKNTYGSYLLSIMEVKK